MDIGDILSIGIFWGSTQYVLLEILEELKKMNNKKEGQHGV